MITEMAFYKLSVSFSLIHHNEMGSENKYSFTAEWNSYTGKLIVYSHTFSFGMVVRQMVREVNDNMEFTEILTIARDMAEKQIAEFGA